MAQLVELGLVETLNDSEMKSLGSPGGKTHSTLSSDVHVYNTRFSFAENLFVQKSRLHMKLKSLSLRLGRDYGTVYTQIGVSSRKEHLKEKFIICF